MDRSSLSLRIQNNPIMTDSCKLRSRSKYSFACYPDCWKSVLPSEGLFGATFSPDPLKRIKLMCVMNKDPRVFIMPPPPKTGKGMGRVGWWRGVLDKARTDGLAVVQEMSSEPLNLL